MMTSACRRPGHRLTEPPPHDWVLGRRFPNGHQKATNYFSRHNIINPMGLGAATSFRWLFGSLWPLGSACAYRNGPAAASTRFGRLFVLASARPGRRPPGRPNRAPAALRSVPALGPACASRRPPLGARQPASRHQGTGERLAGERRAFTRFARRAARPFGPS